MQNATSALSVNPRFNSVKLIGGVDVDANASQYPDLWVKGGATVNKSMIVKDNLLVSGNLFLEFGGSSPDPVIYDVLMFDGNNWKPAQNTITGANADLDMNCFNITNVNEVFVEGLHSKTVSGNIAFFDDIAIEANHKIFFPDSPIVVGNSSTSAMASVPSVAIGHSASASALKSIALGNAALANAGHAIALGVNTTASGDSSVAIGRFSKAQGANAVAIGSSDTLNQASLAIGNNSIAIGRRAFAVASGSIAMGKFADVASMGSTYAVAIGGGANSGEGANAWDSFGIAIGNNASSRGNNSVAIGKDSLALNDDDVTILSGTGASMTAVARIWGQEFQRRDWADGLTTRIATIDETGNIIKSNVSLGHIAGFVPNATANLNMQGFCVSNAECVITDSLQVGNIHGMDFIDPIYFENNTVFKEDATFLGAVNFTTPTGPTSGGTGLTSYTTGDLLFASATDTLSQRGIGTNGQVMVVSGGLPVWSTVSSAGLGVGSVTNSALAGGSVTSAKLAFNSVIADKIATGAVTENKIGAGAVSVTKMATNSIATNSVIDSAISEPKLAINAVSTTKIVDGAVTSAKLGAGAVVTSAILDGAVTEPKIGTAAVTTTKIADDAVTADKLAVDSVYTAAIQNSAVTEDKLATNSVTTTKILDDAITAAKMDFNSVETTAIVDFNVTAPKLGPNSVITSKILDFNVTASKMATDSIATNAIQNGAVTNPKLASDSVYTVNVLNAAITEPKLATDSVSTIKIQNSGITAPKMAVDSVLEASIGTGAVSVNKLATNSVSTTKIVDGAVTAAKLGADSVTTTAVLNGAITAPKLAVDAVTTTSIAAGAVTEPKLATDSVSTVKIVDGAVNDAKLATNAVTLAKILDGAVGVSKLASDSVSTIKIQTQAITSTKMGADSVTTFAIQNGSVTQPKLAADAVATVNLQNVSVTTPKVATDAIATYAIQDLAVTAPKLATDAVTTAAILDGSVTEPKLASNSVSTSKIQNQTITTDKYALLSVDDTVLATDAVTTSKVLDGAIDSSKLASGLALTGGLQVTGDISLSLPGAYTLTGLKEPINGSDAASKEYVDRAVTALSWKDNVIVGTTADLGGTYTAGPDGFNPGIGATLNLGMMASIVIDTTSIMTLNDRVLVKNQTTQFENGIYFLSQVGSVAINWILTRAVDADVSSELNNASTFITNGSVNKNTLWTQVTADPVMGFSDVVFVQFSASSGGTVVSITAGTGLTGGVITSSGTIALQSPVAVSLGGTGQTAPFTAGSPVYAVSPTQLGSLGAGIAGQVLKSNGASPPTWINSSLTINTLGGSGLTGGGLVSLDGSLSLGIGTGAVTNSMLQNSAITVNTGTGLSGGGSTNLGAAGLSLAITTIPVANGGTGQTSALTQGGVVYADSTSSMATSIAGTSGSILISNGVAAPSWLASVPVSSGGTGQTAALNQGGLVWNSSSSSMATTLAGSTGELLQSNGTGAPSWLATVPVVRGGTGQSSALVQGGIMYNSSTSSMASTPAGVTGQILQSNGTGPPTWQGTLAVTTGGTGSSTPLIQGGVMYGSSTSVMGSTPVGSVGQILQSNGASPPSWTTIIPLTTGAQTFYGKKTFNDGIAIIGSIDPMDPVLIGTGTTGLGSTGCVVIGKNPNSVVGTLSVQMGNATYATTPGSVAIGTNAKAISGEYTIAIGGGTAVNAGARASNDRAIAIGALSKSTGTYSIALGKAQANANFAIASGKDAIVSGVGGVAIGGSTTTNNGVAVGFGNTSSGVYSVSLGTFSTASGARTISIGGGAANGADATAADAIAMGYGSTANQFQAIAIGKNSMSIADSGVALGYNAVASGLYSVSVGRSTSSTATHATCIGTTSIASGVRSVAIGSNSTPRGADCIAIGYDTGGDPGGTGINNVAIGRLALTAMSSGSASNNVGIGLHAGSSITTGTGNVAIGKNAQIGGTITNSIAIGSDSLALNNNAVAMGITTAASGPGAVSIGNFTTASFDRAVSIGTLSTATQNSTIAIGDTAAAGSIQSIAIGASCSAITGTKNIAIGQDADCSTTGVAGVGASIAIGSGAKSTGGGAAGGNNISIGTNAKNYAASYGFGGSIGIGKNSYISSDANYSIAIGSGHPSTGATCTSSNSIAIGRSADVSAATAIAVGYNATCIGTSSIALGFNSGATSSNAISIGVSSNSSGTDSIAVGVNSKSQGLSSISIGTSAGDPGTHTGYFNIAMGHEAMNVASLTSANNNTFIGTRSGEQVSGDVANNTFIGPYSGLYPLGGIYGIEYSGYYADVPTFFDTATPTGNTFNVNTISLTPVTILSYQYTGYFYSPVDGDYIFYTTCDDGGLLWLGPNAIDGYTVANVLVNNAGEKAPIEASGGITLKAGYHPIRIQYGNNASSGTLSVAFQRTSAPTIAKTTDFTGYFFNSTTQSFSGCNNVMLGDSTHFATGSTPVNKSVCIGSGSSVGDDEAISIGHSSNAITGSKNIAIGSDVDCSTTGVAGVGASIAIGSGAKSTGGGTGGGNNISIGKNAKNYAAFMGYGGSIAIGAEAFISATAHYSIAIGSGLPAAGPTCTAINSIAIGRNVDVSADFTIAVGYNATCSGAQAIAFGFGSTATNVSAISIGASANATQIFAISIGTSANATQTSAISIGDSSACSGVRAVSIGTFSRATMLESIAIGAGAGVGAGADATGITSIAIGYNSNASGSTSISVGAVNTASGVDSIAIGRLANATMTDTVAIGRQAQATVANGSAFGSAATASGDRSTALGASSVASGVVAIAVGVSNSATQLGSTTIGFQCHATGTQASAIGYKVIASNSNSIAIGTLLTTSSAGGIGIGSGGGVSGTYGIAIGTSAFAKGINDIAIGNGALQSSSGTGTNNVAIGALNLKYSTGTGFNTAVGHFTGIDISTGTYNVGMGINALRTHGTPPDYYITGDRNVAIGDRAIGGAGIGRTADISGSSNTAVGGRNCLQSLTSGSYNSTFGSFAGQSIKDGDSNVCVGRSSGVSLVSGDANICIGYVSGVSGAGVNSSVAIGHGAISDTDAIAIGLSCSAYTSAIAIGLNTTAPGSGCVTLGANADSGGTFSTAIGSLSQATGSVTVAVGGAATALGTGSIAIGRESNATMTYSIGLGHFAQSTGTGSIAIGGAASATGSANATGSFAISIGVNSQAITADSIAIGSNSSSPSVSGVNHIAIGPGANVNGGTGSGGISIGKSCYSAGGQTLALGYTASAGSTFSVAIGASTNTSGYSSVAIGKLAGISNSGTDCIAIGSSATSVFTDSISIGHSASSGAASSPAALQVDTTVIGPVSSNSTGTSQSGQVFPVSTTFKLGTVRLYTGSTSSPMSYEIYQGALTTGGTGALTLLGTVSGVSPSIPNFLIDFTAQNIILTPGSYTMIMASSGTIRSWSATATQDDVNYPAFNFVTGGSASASSVTYYMQINSALQEYPSAIAIGNDSVATGGYSIAIGDNADATGSNSIAIGRSSSIGALTTSSVAIGYVASTSGSGAIAIGRESDATNTHNIALGHFAQSTGVDSIAIGGGEDALTAAIASGADSVAIGRNTVSKSNCVAIGALTEAGRPELAIANQIDTTVLAGTHGGSTTVSDAAQVFPVTTEFKLGTITLFSDTSSTTRTFNLYSGALTTAGTGTLTLIGSISGVAIVTPSYTLDFTSQNLTLSPGDYTLELVAGGITYNWGIILGPIYPAYPTFANVSSGFAFFVDTNTFKLIVYSAVDPETTNAIAIGSNAMGTGSNSIAIGGGVDALTAAIASGTDSISIGSGTNATVANAIAIGSGTTDASGAATIAIGKDLGTVSVPGGLFLQHNTSITPSSFALAGFLDGTTELVENSTLLISNDDVTINGNICVTDYSKLGTAADIQALTYGFGAPETPTWDIYAAPSAIISTVGWGIPPGTAPNGRYVALLDGGTTSYYSADGVSWSAGTQQNEQTNNVIWIQDFTSGDGLYVCGGSGNGTGPVIQTSPDGITWTGRGFTNFVGGDTVAYSPTFGRVVCISHGTQSNEVRIVQSTDGITWTGSTGGGKYPTISGAVIGDSWGGVAWSPKLQMFACVNRSPAGSTRCVMTSPNGMDWTVNTTAPATATTFFDMAWSESLSLFVGTSSTNLMLHSSDGVTWSHVTSVGTPARVHIVWSDTQRAFAGTYFTASTNKTTLSYDGINWSTHITHTAGSTTSNITENPITGHFLVTALGAEIGISPSFTELDTASFKEIGINKYGSLIDVALINKNNTFIAERTTTTATPEVVSIRIPATGNYAYFDIFVTAKINATTIAAYTFKDGFVINKSGTLTLIAPTATTLIEDNAALDATVGILTTYLNVTITGIAGNVTWDIIAKLVTNHLNN